MLPQLNYLVDVEIHSPTSMLLLSETLTHVPIMSLQTGTELARTIDPIIDPRNLTVIAMYVEGPLIDVRPSVLHISDIRESGELGYIVNDSSVLMATEGLVRLQEIVDFQFTLIGTPVYDDVGNSLGKVSDYAYEPTSFNVQQLYIKQPLLKSLSVVSNIIHRKQIIAIKKDRIIVESPTIKERITEKAHAARTFANPFRSSQPESIDLPRR